MSLWIGPLGGLLEVTAPAALQVSRTPVSSYTATLGGRVFEQRASGRARRAWQVRFPDATRPERVAGLRALVDGALGAGPWAWVDSWAAGVNLFTPAACLFEDGTYSPGSSTRTGPVTAADGTWLPASLSVDGPTHVGRPAFLEGQPVPPGHQFTGSLYAMGPGSVTVGLRFIDAANATVGEEQTVVTPAGGAAARATITATAPATAAAAYLTANGATLLAGPQLTMTRHAVPWAPGEGAHRVSVDQLAVSPLVVFDALRLGPVSVIVREVG